MGNSDTPESTSSGLYEDFDFNEASPVTFAGQLKKTIFAIILIAATPCVGACAIFWIFRYPGELLSGEPKLAGFVTAAHWSSYILAAWAGLLLLLRTSYSVLSFTMIAIWRRLPDDRMERFEQLTTMFPELAEHARQAIAGRGYLNRQDWRVGEFLHRRLQSRYLGGKAVLLNDIKEW